MSQIKDFKAEDTLDDDDYEEIDPTAEAEDDVHDIEETETAAKLSNDIDKSFDGENEETLPDADDDDAKEAAKKDENEIKKPTSSWVFVNVSMPRAGVRPTPTSSISLKSRKSSLQQVCPIKM